MNFILNFIKKFIFSINIAFILLLLASYASVNFDPKLYWPLAFLGLFYPVFFIINVIFAFFWLIQLNKKFIFSTIAILIGTKHISQNIQFGNETAKDSGIVLVNYNAGLFGYYQNQWNSTHLFNKIKDMDVDVFCVQEFLNIKTSEGSTLDSCKNIGNFKFMHFEKLNSSKKRGDYGMVIFSKHKIVKSENLHFDGSTGNMCFYSDIEIANKTYRFYNVHLQSYRFKKKDIQFINDIDQEDAEKMTKAKNLLTRMKNAYQARAEQVKLIKNEIKNQSKDMSHFILGDFNDPPVSYAYEQLSKNLKDAFIEKGNGLGRTYTGEMPSFRIDYILFPKSLMCLDYKSHQMTSDHKLLKAVISVNH